MTVLGSVAHLRGRCLQLAETLWLTWGVDNFSDSLLGITKHASKHIYVAAERGWRKANGFLFLYSSVCLCASSSARGSCYPVTDSCLQGHHELKRGSPLSTSIGGRKEGVFRRKICNFTPRCWTFFQPPRTRLSGWATDTCSMLPSYPSVSTDERWPI